jgi:hypothetical protein
MILLKLYQVTSRFSYEDPYKSVEEEWSLEWQGQGWALKRSHAMPRDFCSFCLKVRTSEWRLTTLEMGKNCKQNPEHKVFQSPCLLPVVCLYQRLALPFKEKEKSFHHKVSSQMPAIRKHVQVCSNSFRWGYGFSSSSPKKDWSRTMLIKHGRNS